MHKKKKLIWKRVTNKLSPMEQEVYVEDVLSAFQILLSFFNLDIRRMSVKVMASVSAVPASFNNTPALCETRKNWAHKIRHRLMEKLSLSDSQQDHAANLTKPPFTCMVTSVPEKKNSVCTFVTGWPAFNLCAECKCITQLSLFPLLHIVMFDNSSRNL